MEFTTCNREVLADGYLLCEDARLLTGEVCSAYFGPCGIYFIANCVSFTGEKLYSYLRELLGTVHIRLFVQNLGLYEPDSNRFVFCFSDDAALVADINSWLTDRRQLYKEDVLRQFFERLELEDAKARGYKVLDDGSIHLYKNGEFKPASPYDSELNYFLALFGGALGFHRFIQGKFFSGIAYLFTGGFLLVGWLLDLLSLLLGIQRDKDKRLFFPLSNRRVKLLLLPLGFIASLAYLGVYFSFVNSVLSHLQSSMVSRASNINPQIIENILNLFTNLKT